MHVPAAAAAGATTGVWLFSYNRENFQYDAGMRFQRFMASRGFANSQMSMYREDIHGLTEMTVAKMDTWQSVCTLFLCVCAALSCAGRLGMHGAAPPGWLCALYSGNIFLAILYTGLALWLALHASLRAQCGMVSLLTRKVRLPIPSLAQLDQARVFSSAYEKQRVGDIFRVPFMPHPENAPDLPSASSGDSEPEDAEEASDASPAKKAGTGKDPREAFGSTERDSVPSWVRDEQVVDKQGGMPGASVLGEKADHEQPEHFKIMAKAMEEWWQFDVYARITMLYGVLHFLFAVCYYSLGTTISELRGFWISWSVPMLFLTAQVLILRLDIIRDDGQKYLPKCEWFGHLAPYLAIVGTTLEFRFWYNPTLVTLTWIFVILSLFGHFMFELRLLDLAWPDMTRSQDMPEEATKQWWPAAWRVPTSFSKALWILAPPKKLKVGQHCLMHEMDELKRSGIGSTCRRRRGGADTVTSPQALVQQCMRLDRSFQWWFDGSVWPRVSEKGQRQLHELHARYAPARQQVDQLPGSTSPGTAPDAASDNARRHLVVLLAGVEDELEEVAATNEVSAERGRVGAAEEGAYTGKSPFKDFGSQRAPDLPWQVTRVAILTAAFLWFFMMIASAAECVLGPESLLKPPGEPPWIRDQKTRSWTPAMVHKSSDEGFPQNYALFDPIVAVDPVQHEETLGHGAEGHSGHGAEGSAGHGAEGSSGHGTEASAGGEGSSAEHGADSPAGHGEGSSADHGAGSSADHGSAGHGAGSPTGQSEHRRLAEAYRKRPGVALEDLIRALPEAGQLLDALEAAGAGGETSMPAAAAQESEQAVLPPAFMAPTLRSKDVAWPSLFEPRHLLCGPNSDGQPAVAALTPRGFGALVPLAEGQVEARPFALEGLSLLSRLAGASWTQAGLQFVTAAGELLHCPGHAPSEHGAWRCAPADTERLPLPSGSQVLAAAIGEPTTAAAGRMAALLLQEMPGTVALFAEHAGRGSWRPAGEVHLPPGGVEGLAFAGAELLATTAKGQVLRWHLRDGAVAAHAAPVAGSAKREFRATCALPGGSFARLALRSAARPSGGVSWGPELLMSGA